MNEDIQLLSVKDFPDFFLFDIQPLSLCPSRYLEEYFLRITIKPKTFLDFQHFIDLFSDLKITQKCSIIIINKILLKTSIQNFPTKIKH